ncbi:MAG TPA: DNA primase [Candidatus Saccharimonadales bacterium]|nr:DNA primase [Candidatus Saccharimonadales bacterium]
MDAVDEVKSRLSIEDVISEYVELKRAGRNYKGLSPFTSEKTPSFVVSPEKQIWKDFSSGKGGSMFDFVMEVEGLDFKEALELLARKAGVDLEQYRKSSGGGPDKKRLYELLELSAKFYQVQFSKNRAPLVYVLQTRKFSKDTALTWRIGYSPNTGNALTQYAKSKGFTDEELQLAGLTSKAYRGGFQDMFRGRLMIPLQDSGGRIIGFTARLLEDKPRAPKYINTPQTPLYDKSRHVYGLHFAKEAIRRSGYALLAEGNLDVIASHQAGVKQAVATAGTAITESQLKALSRFTGDIRLCFDSDRAGMAATERAIPIASKVKVSLSIVDIPSGKDPDELIRQDPELWKQAIDNNDYAVDWLISRYEKLLDITSAQGKRGFSDVLLPVIRRLSDPVEIDHYMNLIAEKISVSKDALTQKLDSVADSREITNRKNIKQIVPVPKADAEHRRLQDRFLSLVLLRPTLREFLDMQVTTDMLPTEEGRELFSFLRDNPAAGAEDILKMKNLSDYVKIESLLYDELYQGLELNELHDEAARLQAELVTKFVKIEKEKISLAQRSTTDEVELRSLQEKDRNYNSLLNQVKGAANG